MLTIALRAQVARVEEEGEEEGAAGEKFGGGGARCLRRAILASQQL